MQLLRVTYYSDSEYGHRFLFSRGARTGGRYYILRLSISWPSQKRQDRSDRCSRLVRVDSHRSLSLHGCLADGSRKREAEQGSEACPGCGNAGKDACGVVSYPGRAIINGPYSPFLAEQLLPLVAPLVSVALQQFQRAALMCRGHPLGEVACLAEADVHALGADRAGDVCCISGEPDSLAAEGVDQFPLK